MTDPNTTILQRLMSAAPESDVACAAAGLIAERDRLVRECDRLRVALNTERRPQGRYAFLHRHYALGYVRRENQDLYTRACADAMQRLSEEGAVTYQDYVRKLEEHQARLEALAARVWDWRRAVIALDGVAAAEQGIVALLEEEPRP